MLSAFPLDETVPVEADEFVKANFWFNSIVLDHEFMQALRQDESFAASFNVTQNATSRTFGSMFGGIEDLLADSQIVMPPGNLNLQSPVPAVIASDAITAIFEATEFDDNGTVFEFKALESGAYGLFTEVSNAPIFTGVSSGGQLENWLYDYWTEELSL